MTNGTGYSLVTFMETCKRRSRDRKSTSRTQSLAPEDEYQLRGNGDVSSESRYISIWWQMTGCVEMREQRSNYYLHICAGGGYNCCYNLPFSSIICFWYVISHTLTPHTQTNTYVNLQAAKTSKLKLQFNSNQQVYQSRKMNICYLKLWWFTLKRESSVFTWNISVKTCMCPFCFKLNAFNMYNLYVFFY